MRNWPRHLRAEAVAQVDQLLEKFFRETDSAALMECATRLCCRDNPDDVPALVDALSDALEARRCAAAYALGFARSEPRAVISLMKRPA